MMQTAEARNKAAGERELRAIFRAADRKAKTRKPAIHPMMNAREVCALFGFKRQTLSRRIKSGRLPPPANKATSAPANPILKEMWQRDHRRWDRKLMEALSWGILPEETKSFTCPQDWREWLRDHHSHEEYAL
jgi:hypothetical protein